MINPPTPASFTLDLKHISQQTTEKKELFIFQWLSSLEQDLTISSRDTIKPYQSQLENTLLGLLSSNDPSPNRPIRQIIARCFVIIYRNGDSRSLFDTLSASQMQLANKKLEDPLIKLALVHVIGALSEHHGAKLLSLFPETINLFTKTLKNSREIDISIRYETIISLARAIKGAGRSCSDIMIKEFIKLAKSGLLDRYIIIKNASAQLLENVYKYTNQLPPLKADEYEALLLSFCKPLESSDYSLRRAISSLMASIMFLSQSNAPIIKETQSIFGKFGLGAATQPASSTASEKLILNPDEMFSVIISVFTKITLKEVKIGVLEAYALLLRQLGVRFLESNYIIVVKKLLELATHPKTNISESDSLFIKEGVKFLLRDAVGKMISEVGQINAAKEISIHWLRKWPAVTGNEIPPSDETLVLVLDELASLLIDLGPAAASSQDIIIDPLAVILAHPSQSVNLSVACCMRSLCLSLPDQLPRLISKLISLIQRDTGASQADKLENADRIIGYGNSLASLICVIPLRPLYISYESAALVFGISTQLIKGSSSKDNALAAVHSLSAWTLIGSLMTLGVSFVKVHMSQLLLIWKTCFPKPISKEIANRTELEWNALLVGRYAAISALYSFLFHNKELITSDISKRVVVLLNNMLQFITNLPSSYASVSISQGVIVSIEAFQMKLVDREALIKAKLFQCYALIHPSHYEFSGPQLLKFCLDNFIPDPDKIDRWAASVATANDKTQNVDADILTSLVDGLQVKVAMETGSEDRGIGKVLNGETDVGKLEKMTNSIFGSLENDPTSIFLMKISKTLLQKPAPLKPSIALADAAIELFCILFPLQASNIQENSTDLLIKYSKYTGSKISQSRKYALQINSAVAVVGCLKFVMVKRGCISSAKVFTAIQELVEDLLSSEDSVLRAVSSEALGRLARSVGNPAFVNSLVQSLIDQIINNREPHCRSGSALALGTINSYMGGMASGPHLKNIVGILHSLASDAHCLVHTWALHSLWLTIESTGLMYNPYVNSTLTLVTRLFMSDTHEATATESNLPGGDRNSEVFPAFGRILHALVGVLGPELHGSIKIRDVFYTIYNQLKNDSDPFTVTEAVLCVQQFILFAPKLIDTMSLVPFLQQKLASGNLCQVHVMRKAAIHCLYQLAQKDAGAVLSSSVDCKLEEQLFALLDTELDSAIQDEIKDILILFLKHVASTAPSRWITLCRNILSKGNSDASVNNGSATGRESEEVLNEGQDDKSELPTSSTESAPKQNDLSSSIVFTLLPRWRTQIFALSCLRKVLVVASTSSIREHFDLKLARETTALLKEEGKDSDFLIFKLTDLIMISFSASTSNLYELKLEGLLFLQDILEKYSDVADPDFEDHSLLEQYQAQITSALAPAFDEFNGPELVATASTVCSYYMGRGIHQEIGSLSRLLKLTHNLLDLYSKIHSQESFPNGKLILKVAIMSSQADLYLSSLTYPQLKPIVEPNLATLVKQWTSILFEFAKLSLDSDFSTELVSLSNNSESTISRKMDVYVAAISHVTLPYYKKSWIKILTALTTVLNLRSDLDSVVFTSEPNENLPKEIHLMLGLCVDCIQKIGTIGTSSFKTNSISNGISEAESQQNLTKQISSVEAIGLILKKSSSMKSPLDAGIYNEIMTVFDRLMQTEGINLQSKIIAIIQDVILRFPENYFVEERSQNLLDDSVITGSPNSDFVNLQNVPGCIPSVSKLYKTIKVLYNVFLYQIPGFLDNPSSTLLYRTSLNNESISLIIAAITAFTDLLSRPKVIENYSKEVLPLACIIFTSFLENDKFSLDISTKITVCMKKLFDCAKSIVSNDDPTMIELFQLAIGDMINMIEDEDESIDLGQTLKLKNILISITTIITIFPVLSYVDENQKIFVEILISYLKKELFQQTCVQCIRNLMMLSFNEDPTVSSIGNAYCIILLPVLITHLKYLAEEFKSGNQKITISFLEEIVKTFLALCFLSKEEIQKPSVIAIISRSLISMIAETEETEIKTFNSLADQQLFILISSSLMQLAAKENSNFKVMISTLACEEKVKLEKALKSLPLLQDNQIETQSRQNGTKNGGIGMSTAQPKIQLKNFFNS